jgi:hypothetical protein
VWRPRRPLPDRRIILGQSLYFLRLLRYLRIDDTCCEYGSVKTTRPGGIGQWLTSKSLMVEKLQKSLFRINSFAYERSTSWWCGRRLSVGSASLLCAGGQEATVRGGGAKRTMVKDSGLAEGSSQPAEKRNKKPSSFLCYSLFMQCQFYSKHLPFQLSQNAGSVVLFACSQAARK